eukprot:GHVL01042303.1.p1 GENE.GHVL01042303.1~~GHVL01042303.1.p1  ORF type:complete len:296 (+),score=31.76 GHVL01042303.1:1195-2082(+)
MCLFFLSIQPLREPPVISHYFSFNYELFKKDIYPAWYAPNCLMQTGVVRMRESQQRQSVNQRIGSRCGPQEFAARYMNQQTPQRMIHTSQNHQHFQIHHNQAPLMHQCIVFPRHPVERHIARRGSQPPPSPFSRVSISSNQLAHAHRSYIQHSTLAQQPCIPPPAPAPPSLNIAPPLVQCPPSVSAHHQRTPSLPTPRSLADHQPPYTKERSMMGPTNRRSISKASSRENVSEKQKFSIDVEDSATTAPASAASSAASNDNFFVLHPHTLSTARIQVVQEPSPVLTAEMNREINQ